MPADMHNLPWIEKYRPGKLEDIYSHYEIIDTLKKYLANGCLPNLIFYGPAGCGKTSTALSIAKFLYSAKELSSMVLELNASDDRGIGIVRETILNFASTKTFFNSKFKLVILDEADAMTNDAQNALRRIIEKSIENVRFCIICNLLNGVIPAIQSRCTKFRFAPLDKISIDKQLIDICLIEKLNWNQSGINVVSRLCDGDMRKAINILQGTSMSHAMVDEDSVYLTTGYPNASVVDSVIKTLLNDKFDESYNC